MDNNQQFSDSAIDAAISAYNDLTPDSITAFRELNDIEAIVVIRVLRTTNPVKVPRSRRRDAGSARGPKATETKA